MTSEKKSRTNIDANLILDFRNKEESNKKNKVFRRMTHASMVGTASRPLLVMTAPRTVGSSTIVRKLLGMPELRLILADSVPSWCCKKTTDIHYIIILFSRLAKECLSKRCHQNAGFLRVPMKIAVHSV